MKQEIVTPELKAKVFEQFEKSDKLINEQAEFIEELQRRLRLAEDVCSAVNLYLKSINSPFCVGWDMMIDALKKWVDDKAERIRNQ